MHQTIQLQNFNYQQMMKEQDQGLEMLGQSAERLSKISMGIHEELGHQNKWVNNDHSVGLVGELRCYIGFLTWYANNNEGDTCIKGRKFE